MHRCQQYLAETLRLPFIPNRTALAPVASQTQQHHEQVDEIEVERQRAHHGLAARGNSVVARVVHPLDPLGIIGGEAREDADADD